MKVLFFIVTYFLVNSVVYAQSFFCDGGTLINSNGSIAHQFTFSSECQEALKKSKAGLFCVGGLLKNWQGVSVQQFTFGSECDSALKQVTTDGLFCVGPILKNKNGLVVHQFTFTSECVSVLNKTVNGMFCAGNQLKNLNGAVVKIFTFSSECEAALGSSVGVGYNCDGTRLVSPEGKQTAIFVTEEDCKKSVHLMNRSCH